MTDRSLFSWVLFALVVAACISHTAGALIYVGTCINAGRLGAA